MQKDFKNINYMLSGSTKQKSAFKAINDLKILMLLKEFKPLVVGTIPIALDIEGSDIDIVCMAKDLNQFEMVVKSSFGSLETFKQSRKLFQGFDSSVSSFRFSTFDFELFAQPIEPHLQNAYRHMIIEDRLLNLAVEGFRQRVVELKKTGIKTEAAFAKLLSLEGDPYVELLKLEDIDEIELSRLLNEWAQKKPL